MPITSDRLKHQAKKSTTNSVLNRKLVHRTSTAKTPFIKQSVVPPGTYVARITAVKDAQSAANEDAIDIIYELTNTKGKVVTAKERYPIEGYLLEKLIVHWFDSQLLPADATYSDIVGIEEQVDITYVHARALGNLKNRRPCNQVASKTPRPKAHPVEDDVDEEELEDDSDDQFDDFLEDEDEDDL